MVGLIFVETSSNAKARIVRRRILFALARLGCVYLLVLKEIRLDLSGLLTACKTTLEGDRQGLKRPSHPKHLSAWLG